jgi:hypothetical protein
MKIFFALFFKKWQFGWSLLMPIWVALTLILEHGWMPGRNPVKRLVERGVPSKQMMPMRACRPA